MATYGIEQQVYQRFLGIREVNGINSQGMLSASKADNVEFYQAELTNCVGIKTQKGRQSIYEFPEGYTVLKCWKSEQRVNEDDTDATTFIFAYAENGENGAVFVIKPDIIKPLLLIKDLAKTGVCNGLTMSSTAYDIFVFTNREKQYAISYAREAEGFLLCEPINAIDYKGRAIKWVSMTEWNGFLVVASQYGVHASHQNEIFVWNDNPQTPADSWYIDYSRKVTCVAASQSGCFIFTEKNVDYLNTTPNDTSSAYKVNASLNGTLSHQSYCVHDKYLFFYDPIQKNIYYFFINDTNQIQIADAMATEVQSYFENVKTLEMTSCIYGGFNQIWVLINNSKLLIFDYLTKEWITRTGQKTNGITYLDNKVICAVNNHLMQENINYDFNGEFYPSEYKTAFINCGSNTNMKKEKTPILLILNDKAVNNFYVQLTVNGKLKAPKLVQLIPKGQGSYAGEDEPIITPEEQVFDSADYADDESFNKKVAIISTPQTWYNLGLRIFTQYEGQAFCIDSIEIKNIKAKTKTTGR